jgi:predicted unusual protein kinase regulating ubiquinone biosynthesis (AarF/ABC1/UbiB family)
MRNWTRPIKRRFHSARDASASSASAIPVLSAAAPAEQRARSIRSYLQQLGSFYQCFALYLSSRIDILPAEYCHEFSLTPDSAPPLSEAVVAQLMAEEYGSDTAGVFIEFDFVPAKSALISQTHLAKLRNGTPVLVVVLRPEYYALQAHAPLLDNQLLHKIFAEMPVEGTVGDFTEALQRRTNFTLRADSLQLLAADKSLSGLLAAPTINRTLCRSKILVLEQHEERSIAQFVQLHPYHKEELAVRLCQLWLEQAMFGRCYTVGFQEEDIAIRDGGQVSLCDGDLTRLPRLAQTNLWNYLLATVMDDPDRAAMHLLQEMSHAGSSPAEPERFRSNFRQAASFGVLEPILGTNSNSLAQLVFQHWKTAMEHGYRAPSHVLAFYRGLFGIARIARTLSPMRDPLREGLEELRSTKTFQRAGRLRDLSSWLDDVDKFATSFAELPITIDEALSIASQAPRDYMVLSRTQQSAEPKRRHLLGSMEVVFIIAVTVFLSNFSGLARWTVKLAALAIMLAGCLLLRQIED